MRQISSALHIPLKSLTLLLTFLLSLLLPLICRGEEMVFERMGKDVLSPYERSIAMLPDGRLAVVSDERMEEFDGVKSEKIRGKAGIIKLPDITVFIIFI